MECNGQCHLKKELKKINQLEEKSTNSTFPIEKIVETEIPVFLVQNYSCCEHLSAINVTYEYSQYFEIINKYQFNFFHESFHPPQV